MCLEGFLCGKTVKTYASAWGDDDSRSSAEALQLTRMDIVMKISNHNGLAASCEGDLGGSTFLLNNEEVKLQTYLEMHKQKNAGGYIKLISRDGSRD